MNHHIGAVIPREGKCSLVIFEIVGDKFIAYQKLWAIKECDLLRRFAPEDLRPGNILRNGQSAVELVECRSTGYWDVKIPGERIELSAKELEELEAAGHARRIADELVTRYGETFTCRYPRVVPSRMEPWDDLER